MRCFGAGFDHSSNCPGRLFASTRFNGLFFSYAPCLNNINNNNFPFFLLRGGREDGDEDAGFERSGDLIANNAGEDDDGDVDDGEFIKEVTLDSTT